MGENQYRSEIYAKYATLQMKGWKGGSGDGQKINRRAIVARIGSWLPRNRDAKCLDLGCGSGQLLLALQEARFTNVCGVDVSPESVALARQANSEVIEMDILEFLQKDTRRWDLITAFDVLEHFRKDEAIRLVKLIRERIEAGGYLILQLPNATTPWASHYRYHDLTHEIIYDKTSIGSLLALAGFEVRAIREVGPHAHGVVSAIRWLLWKVIWCGLAFWNLVETGDIGGGVYTRNMLVWAVCKDDS